MTWRKHTSRMPISKRIAMYFPNHRQMIAPAFWQIFDHESGIILSWVRLGGVRMKIPDARRNVK